MGRWFRWLVRRVVTRDVRRRVRRELDGVYVAGLDDARRAVESYPVLMAANHVSFWDSMLLYVLSERLGLPFSFVMDQANLDRFPYFAEFGAIGVDLARPGGARAGMEAAAGWLSEPGRMLWFFPQGRQRPQHLRPLDLKPGVARLAEVPGVRVLPVVFAYAFHETSRPAAYVWFGPTLPPAPSVADVDAALRAGLEETDRALERPAPPFHPIVAPPAQRGRADRMLSILWRILA